MVIAKSDQLVTLCSLLAGQFFCWNMITLNIALNIFIVRDSVTARIMGQVTFFCLSCSLL